jgi:UDP-GlcNAc:undecaprenyl-phosphate GlcNAc-1-phosphate transferase
VAPASPLRELALVGLTAAIITYFATGPVRVLATRLGAVAYPRERDVHVTPTPRMGGLAIFVGIIAAVFLASQLPRSHAVSSTPRACRRWSWQAR